MKTTDSDYTRCNPSSCAPGRSVGLVRALALALMEEAQTVRVSANRRHVDDQFAYGRANGLDNASSQCFDLLDQLEGRKPMPEPTPTCGPSECNCDDCHYAKTEPVKSGERNCDCCCSPSCCLSCCCPIPSDVRFTVTGEPQKSEPDPIVLETMEGQTWEIAAVLAQLGENRPTEFAITKTTRAGDAEESIEVRCNYGD